MADISFVYNALSGFSDLTVSGGDFLLDDTLRTAVELSIFTDRRATAEEIRLAHGNTTERESRRGYWANTFKKYAQGSGLWLLQRGKKTESNLALAEKFCNDALAWLISDGIAESVAAVVRYEGEALVVEVSIKKPGNDLAGFKYQYAWKDLEVIQ